MVSIIISLIIVASTAVLSYLLFDLMLDGQDALNNRPNRDMYQYPKGPVGHKVNRVTNEIFMDEDTDGIGEMGQAKDIFGRTKQEAMLCIACKKPATDKCYADAGKDEHHISVFCEECFDKRYGVTSLMSYLDYGSSKKLSA
jgi:hypothetical protein